MKGLKSVWWIIYMACMVVSVQAIGQSGQMAEDGYYVVINAYAQSKEAYATRYFEKIKGDGDEVSYAFVPAKRMYFVYLQHTMNYREAIDGMRNARKDPRFPEAWVYVSNAPLTSINPAASTEKGDADSSVEMEETAVSQSTLSDEVKQDSSTDDISIGQVDADAMQELDNRLEPPKNVKQVVFILSNSRNNEEVNGDVQIIDTERAKLIDVQDAGEIAELQDPDNGTGNITFLCDVFGYRKEQKDLNYQELESEEGIQMVNDYFVVFFDLVRYHKGDIATMYNVYFFNDAAIMRPESRYEVNNLLNMMRENPNYKIKIHGHTNGRSSGKLIAQGSSEEFFALNDKNKDGVGSAKVLSKRRAELIRDYLISQGIQEERMVVKAWGGRRMLYDKNSSMAKKNVRVEIEILEE